MTILQSLSNTVATFFSVDPADIVWSPPPKNIVGHFSLSWPMQYAKRNGLKPMDVASALVKTIQSQKGVVKCDVVPPGFVNVTLESQVLMQHALDTFDPTFDKKGTLLLEYVSANPTGPLHMGHARQAAIGNALARIYERMGWGVVSEYYYNDEGNQIEVLVSSVQAWMQHLETGVPLCMEEERARESSDTCIMFSKDWYKGLYIRDLAENALKMGIPSDDRVQIRTFSTSSMFANQQLTLNRLGIRFDHYALESSYHGGALMQRVMQTLLSQGRVYSQDGALFFKSDNLEDFVVRKSNGTYAYCFPDMVYHVDKFERGYDRMVNIQGSDHQYTVLKVKEGLSALHLDVHRLHYVLHSMVRMEHNGVLVKPSKRAGNFIALDDILDESGKDPLLFSLLENSNEKSQTLKLEVLVSKGLDNPVYYAQMAHARLRTLLMKKYNGCTSWEASPEVPAACNSMLVLLSQYRYVLQGCDRTSSPHLLYKHALELAKECHALYDKAGPVDALLVAQKEALGTVFELAARQLSDALQLLGVDAPSSMALESREKPTQASR